MKRRRAYSCVSLLVGACLAVGGSVAPSARAADDPAAQREQEERIQKALHRIGLEPTVQEVQEQTVRFYQVEPARLESLKSASNLRALLPTIAGRFGYGWDRRVRSLDDNLVPLATRESYDTGAYGASVTAAWDLPTLVFNAAELQTYALTGIRINVLKEVSRFYFIRRQVLLQLLVNPPKDPLSRIGLEQRVLEFTALIDSFTGGYFSRELELRGLNAPTPPPAPPVPASSQP